MKRSSGRKKKDVAAPEVILLGDSSVGKTSIIRRLVQNTFIKAPRPTIKVQKTPYTIYDVTFHFIDTPIERVDLKNVVGAIIVYDITDAQTFRHTWEHFNKVRKLTSLFGSMLLGNKSDLEELREVSKEEGQACVMENDVLFAEVSAAEGTNIQYAIELLFHRIITQSQGVLQEDDDEELDAKYQMEQMNERDLNGAHVDPTTIFSKCTRAIKAKNLEELQALLLDYANVEKMCDPKGRTLLMYASMCGAGKIVRFLVTHCDPDIDAVDKVGLTAIIIASRAGHVDCVRYLIHGNAAVNVCEKSNRFTPLHFATLSQNQKIMSLLVRRQANLEAKALSGETPLHIACSTSVDVVKILLRGKANPNAEDENGVTPLIIACHFGKKEIAKQLIAAGAKINKDGFSPLHSACLYSQLELVQLLIHAGANPNVVEQSIGATPLVYASYKGQYQIIKFLLHHQADVLVRTKDNKNCLHYATISGSDLSVKAILAHAPQLVRFADQNGYTPLMISSYTDKKVHITKILLEYEQNVNVCTNKGKAALHFATLGSSRDTVDLLLRNGANPYIYSNLGFAADELTLDLDIIQFVGNFKKVHPELRRERDHKRTLLLSRPAKIADAMREEGIDPSAIFKHIADALNPDLSIEPIENMNQLIELVKKMRAENEELTPSANEHEDYCIALDELLHAKHHKFQEMKVIDASQSLSMFYDMIFNTIMKLFLYVLAVKYFGSSHQKSFADIKNNLEFEKTKIKQSRLVLQLGADDLIVEAESPEATTIHILLLGYLKKNFDPLENRRVTQMKISIFAQHILKVQQLCELIARKLTRAYQIQILRLTVVGAELLAFICIRRIYKAMAKVQHAQVKNSPIATVFIRSVFHPMFPLHQQAIAIPTVDKTLAWTHHGILDLTGLHTVDGFFVGSPDHSCCNEFEKYGFRLGGRLLAKQLQLFQLTEQEVKDIEKDTGISNQDALTVNLPSLNKFVIKKNGMIDDVPLPKMARAIPIKNGRAHNPSSTYMKNVKAKQDKSKVCIIQ